MAAPVQTLGKDRTNSGNSTTTTVLTVLGASTAGNTVTVHTSTRSGGNNCTGITDSKSNTYVRVGSSFVSANSGEIVDIFVCANPVALTTSDTITATFAGTGNARAVLAIEWGGSFTVPATPINTGDVSAVTTAPASVQVTPDNASAIVVGTIAMFSSSVAPTVASPFTVWDTQANTSGSTQEVSVAYRQESSTAADGPAWTTPNQKSASFTFTLDPASTGTPASVAPPAATATADATAPAIAAATNLAIPAAAASADATAPAVSAGVTIAVPAAAATAAAAAPSIGISVTIAVPAAAATATATAADIAAGAHVAVPTAAASAAATAPALTVGVVVAVPAAAAIAAMPVPDVPARPAASTPPPVTNVTTWPLTAAQIGVLQAPVLEVDFGVETLDSNDVVTGDITADVVTGEVDRDNYATVHGTCKLDIVRALQWGAVRVRPYMVLQANGLAFRWNLGVYILTTPDRPVGESPATYSATGYDKLYLLGQLIGDTYSVAAGTDVLTAVAAAITSSGVGGQVNIDGTAAGKTLASDLVWPLDEQNQATWLRVINDLLATIGYRGMYADRDGALRAEPYVTPADRSPLWAFDADDELLSLVGFDRTETQDLWPVPNWWRFIQRGLATAPTEGAGQYTVATADDDPTSAASLGYTKRSVVFLDAADQDSLVAQGNQQVATDRQVTQTLDITTAPFPIAWHFDVYTYADSQLGGEVKVQSASWTLPLDGSDMTHKWEVVS